MNVRDIDHITLTVTNLDHTMRFYHEVLDLPVVSFTKDLLVVQLGHQKVEFRKAGNQYDPAIANPTPCASAFTITVKDSLTYLKEHLANYGVTVVKGPVKTRGADGPMISLYIYDPDKNLIEVSSYHQTNSAN